MEDPGRRSFLRTLVWFSLVPGELAQEKTRTRRRIAVIVHPDNPLVNVSRGGLERIFRLRQQHWSNGQRIYLLMREEGSLAKKIVLDRIYRMTSDELKRFWLAKIYRGEMTSFPKTFSSDESVVRFVGQVPNAIGFIDAAHAHDSVRVVPIDGRLPYNEGYLLTEGDLGKGSQ